MRTLTCVAAAIALSSAAHASSTHSKKAHIRKDGTHVAPSQATNPNGTKLDNYSTKGNVNPHTGKQGSVDPYAPKKTKG